LKKGEKEYQGVYHREYRQGSEKACKRGNNSLIYLILEFHKPSNSFYRVEVRSMYKANGGKNQMLEI